MEMGNENIDISVIIPIYNVERYLERCIDSVLMQKDVFMEIILVDDGSQDGCPGICDDYLQKDSRIKVIHKENAGLGYARNSGLDIAKGKFIFFLDSDDWIPDMSLGTLMRLARENDVDIIAFKMIQTSKEEIFKIENRKEIVNRLIGKEIIKAYLQGEITTTAWGKLYKREIFEDIRFEKVPLHEDAYSMHLVLDRAKAVVLVNQIFYVQYIRPGSLTQTPFRRDNFISIECGERILDFVDERYPEYHDDALRILLRRQKDIIERMIKDDSYSGYQREFVALLKDIEHELETFSENGTWDTDRYLKLLKMGIRYPNIFVVGIKMNFFRRRMKSILGKGKRLIAKEEDEKAD